MLRIESWVAGFRPYALLGAAVPARSICRASPRSRRSTATRRVSRRRRGRCSKPAISSASVSRTRRATRSRPASTGCRPRRSSLFSTPASTAIWPYRLPSLIGATAAVLLTFAFGCRLLPPLPDEPGGVCAAPGGAVLLGSSLLLVARGAHRQDRRGIAGRDRRRAGRARPRLCAAAPPRAGRAGGSPLVFWLARNRRDPAQGTGPARCWRS